MMRTAVLRLCGHRSTGPSGVFDQSFERIRSPISPPPERKAKSDVIPLEPSFLEPVLSDRIMTGDPQNLVYPLSPYAP